MTDPAPSLLNAAQVEAMSAWVRRLSRSIQERAHGLVATDAVRRIWWTRPGEQFRALVQGGRLYNLLGEFTADGAVAISCACPYGWGCKHAAALFLAILDGEEIEPSDELPAMTSTPLPKAEPEIATAGALGLVAQVRQITGKNLGKMDTKACERIAAIFAAGRNSIPENELERFGQHSYYGYYQSSPVQLWPAHRPPASIVEAWFYVAQALRARQRLPASNLFSKVPWERVDALIAPWLREQEIDRWKARLTALSRGPASGPRSPRYRLRLGPDGAVVECQPAGTLGFAEVKPQLFRQHQNAANASVYRTPEPHLDEAAIRFLQVLHQVNGGPSMTWRNSSLALLLQRLLRVPGFEDSVVTAAGQPLRRAAEALQWRCSGPHAPACSDPSAAGEYEFQLQLPDGTDPPRALLILPGEPVLHVSAEAVHALAHAGFIEPERPADRVRVPVAALESSEGIEALGQLQLPVPESVAARVVTLPAQVTVRARLSKSVHSPTEQFQLQARSVFPTEANARPERWNGEHWEADPGSSPAAAAEASPERIVRLDRRKQAAAAAWIGEMGGRVLRGWDGEIWLEQRLPPAVLRSFPEEFLAWLERRPDGVEAELDPELASLRDGTLAGTVRLEAESAGMDWFDLRVVVQISEVDLTQAEIDALLKAPGRWVRLTGKGWRRLDFQLTDEERRQLADLGLGVGDLGGGEPQRLHVLQLAGTGATRLLPEKQIEAVRRRAAQLKTEVQPEQPTAITAELRPYQRAGYHFLAYLSENRFGGILADDMGLGKTVQALTWLAWLREKSAFTGGALVVCPKSVQENWRAEAARFYPGLAVRCWTREEAGTLGSARAKELLIINYAQLRLHEEALTGRKWAAVILDEAQFIKNPTSASARAACRLKATHRLALSGTPIENRLLDLWSIMTFAMPGVLGTKAAFTRHFNAKDDPLARRRLAARVRPFVLRRTKQEVARDLPARTEEDLVCTLEGAQATLYQAELKRARALLLGAKTNRQLDSVRFHILSSLLRLRQICCHPWLVGSGQPKDESAKLDALFDLLEPLVAEGHKVLVFSQFVEMLELIRQRVIERSWSHLLLTGQTEDRAALVADFQATSDACIFLISLKAGGFGLNLTAASYVVLFDPWWNPAVENQAIDRTHRIGQTNPVIAYRLVVRESIEEKIRHLQKQKSALAADVLGEETFAKALTLADFKFLLE